MYDYPNHIGPLCSSEIAHLSYHSESWGPCILQCSHYSGWKGSDFFGDSPSVATLHSPFFLKVLKLLFLKKTSENIVENYGTHSSFGKKKKAMFMDTWYFKSFQLLNISGSITPWRQARQALCSTFSAWGMPTIPWALRVNYMLVFKCVLRAATILQIVGE